MSPEMPTIIRDVWTEDLKVAFKTYRLMENGRYLGESIYAGRAERESNCGGA
jgi:hypothetical protein